MRRVTRRADVSITCYFVDRSDGTRVPEMTVTPDERGWFNVYSARSGNTYRVGTDGVCSCPASGPCRHLEAVYAHAARVLGK